MIAQANPIRTLIVDDSKDECMLLRAQLRGVDSVKVIASVHDGVEALSYVRGIGRFKDREVSPYPDLILLDFQMPFCSGLEVLEQLSHQLHHPRVILWSNTLDQLDIPLAMRLGADLVCRKPFSRPELIEVIDRLKAKVFSRIPIPFQRDMEEQPAHVCD